jgi:hypothetical protein
MDDRPQHTFAERDGMGNPLPCPACADTTGEPRTSCDQVRYSPALRRFYRAHAVLYRAMLYDADPRASASARQQLESEFRTLPPGHDCSCRCPFEREGCAICESTPERKRPRPHDCRGKRIPPCVECQKLRRDQANEPLSVTVEIGRTQPRQTPSPNEQVLDLTRD